MKETEVTSTPTRPVDNVVITTKCLQDRNIHILDGTTVENKGKLIFKHDFKIYGFHSSIHIKHTNNQKYLQSSICQLNELSYVQKPSIIDKSIAILVTYTASSPTSPLIFLSITTLHPFPNARFLMQPSPYPNKLLPQLISLKMSLKKPPYSYTSFTFFQIAPSKLTSSPSTEPQTLTWLFLELTSILTSLKALTLTANWSYTPKHSSL